eukprot:3976325-Pleurochrysis_carterae.AAC.2
MAEGARKPALYGEKTARRSKEKATDRLMKLSTRVRPICLIDEQMRHILAAAVVSESGSSNERVYAFAHKSVCAIPDAPGSRAVRKVWNS